MSKKKIAVYPGSFDPITYGHLDVINRACALFDEVIIGVAHNSLKTPLFDEPLRVQLIEENIADLPQCKVIAFSGLTVNFAQEIGAQALIRGLRAVSDFEYEFQMAQMNRHLNHDIETIFLMPSQKYFYTSSKLMKSVARYSRDQLTELVPTNVINAFDQKHS